MLKLVATIAGLGLSMLALAGCATSEPTSPSVPFIGEESEFIITDDPLTLTNYPNAIEEAPFAVINSENSLFLAVGGSGSCPPEIASVKPENGDVRVNLKLRPEQTVCTEDYRIYGFSITALSVDFKFNSSQDIFICNNDKCSQVTIKKTS